MSVLVSCHASKSCFVYLKLAKLFVYERESCNSFLVVSFPQSVVRLVSVITMILWL